MEMGMKIMAEVYKEAVKSMETKSVLKEARKRKSVVFPEGVAIYRKTITELELFDVIKCLRKNRYDEQRCKTCAYFNFCRYPLRFNIQYW